MVFLTKFGEIGSDFVSIQWTNYQDEWWAQKSLFCKLSGVLPEVSRMNSQVFQQSCDRCARTMAIHGAVWTFNHPETLIVRSWLVKLNVVIGNFFMISIVICKGNAFGSIWPRLWPCGIIFVEIQCSWRTMLLLLLPIPHHVERHETVPYSGGYFQIIKFSSFWIIFNN